MLGSEKRQHRRAPTSITVDYKIGDITGRCIATDISQNGIFLNINPPPEIGSRIYLSFVLPGYSKLPPLKIVGKVVRVVKMGDGQIPGVGVEFDLIYAESRETIRSFIRKILGPTVVVSKQKDVGIKGKHYRLDYKNIAQKGPIETETTKEDEINLNEFNAIRISHIDPSRLGLILKLFLLTMLAASIGYLLYILTKYL